MMQHAVNNHGLETPDLTCQASYPILVHIFQNYLKPSTGQKMSSLLKQCLELLRFLALSEAEKISRIFDNNQAWYVKTGEQPVLILFEQFFEYTNYLLASQEFHVVFQENPVLNELYAFMELVYESGDRFRMDENKYYQRDLIEFSPIWKLIRRLAQETLIAANEENTQMTMSFEDIICL